MALGAIRAARRAGLAVPGDVSIVGYDDSFLMGCTEPPLTTVRQPIEPMSRMVIELLLGQMNGTPVPHHELLFEPELVVRGSTGPVRTPPSPASERRAALRIGSRLLPNFVVVKFLRNLVESCTLRPQDDNVARGDAGHARPARGWRWRTRCWRSARSAPERWRTTPPAGGATR